MIDWDKFRKLVDSSKKLVIAVIGLGFACKCRGLNEQAYVIQKYTIVATGTKKLNFEVPMIDYSVTGDYFLNGKWIADSSNYVNNPILIRIGHVDKGDELKAEVSFFPVGVRGGTIDRVFTFNGSYDNVYIVVEPKKVVIKKIADKTYSYDVRIVLTAVAEPTQIHYGLVSMFFDSRYLPYPPDNCTAELRTGIIGGVSQSIKVTEDLTKKYTVKNIKANQVMSVQTGIAPKVGERHLPYFEYLFADMLAREDINEAEAILQVYNYKCTEGNPTVLQYGVMFALNPISTG